MASFHIFPIHHPLRFVFAEEHAFQKFQGNLERLELYRAHQLLIYADDVNLLVENINIIKENRGALLDTSKEVSSSSSSYGSTAQVGPWPPLFGVS
jgi:hypothetical protein